MPSLECLLAVAASAAAFQPAPTARAATVARPTFVAFAPRAAPRAMFDMFVGTTTDDRDGAAAEESLGSHAELKAAVRASKARLVRVQPSHVGSDVSGTCPGSHDTLITPLEFALFFRLSLFGGLLMRQGSTRSGLGNGATTRDRRSW